MELIFSGMSTRREFLRGTVIAGTEAALVAVATACGSRTYAQPITLETPKPTVAPTVKPSGPVTTSEWMQIYVDQFAYHFFGENYW